MVGPASLVARLRSGQEGMKGRTLRGGSARRRAWGSKGDGAQAKPLRHVFAVRACCAAPWRAPPTKRSAGIDASKQREHGHGVADEMRAPGRLYGEGLAGSGDKQAAILRTVKQAVKQPVQIWKRPRDRKGGLGAKGGEKRAPQKGG